MRSFRFTHPFHPLFGREFPLVTVRFNWSHARVYYHDDQQQLQSVPLEWTSLAADDPVVLMGQGQVHFRLLDLLELARLLRRLQQPVP